MELRQLNAQNNTPVFFFKESENFEGALKIKVSGILNSEVIKDLVQFIDSDTTIYYASVAGFAKFESTKVEEELLQEEIIKSLKTWKSFLNEAKDKDVIIKVPEDLILSRKFIMNHFNISAKTFGNLVNL